MAAADADCFISTEVGAYGSCLKLDIWTITEGQSTEYLPSDARGVSKPFVLVGDKMVALSENVLRP